MKKLLIALAGFTALTAPSVANAGATINFGATTPIPDNNDFKTNLNNLGLTQYATTGASIILDPGQVITFYFVGAESGFSDTFTTTGATPVTMTEALNNNENHFGAPILIGADTFAAGTLAGMLNFTSSGPGAPGTVGTDPFAIFLGPNQVTGTNVSEFYFGYDDQINNVDDNHDDFVIHAIISSVPEPATWAMMLFGFAGIGLAMRRRRSPGLAQLA
jgi:hypothetical protein